MFLPSTSLRFLAFPCLWFLNSLRFFFFFISISSTAWLARHWFSLPIWPLSIPIFSSFLMDMISFPYTIFLWAVTWDSPAPSVPAHDTGSMSESAVSQTPASSLLPKIILLHARIHHHFLPYHGNTHAGSRARSSTTMWPKICACHIHACIKLVLTQPIVTLNTLKSASLTARFPVQ